MKAYGEVEVCIHAFLSLTLDVYGLKAPSTHTIEDWVESRVSLDALKKRKISFFPSKESIPVNVVQKNKTHIK